MRNLSKIFLRSFGNVGPDLYNRPSPFPASNCSVLMHFNTVNCNYSLLSVKRWQVLFVLLMMYNACSGLAKIMWLLHFDCWVCSCLWMFWNFYIILQHVLFIWFSYLDWLCISEL